MRQSNENPLRYWRDERGKTQRGLAIEADVSARTIANIEGGRKATRANLKKLAKALDIDFSELASLEEDDRAERGRKGGLAAAARTHKDQDISGGTQSRAA